MERASLPPSNPRLLSAPLAASICKWVRGKPSWSLSCSYGCYPREVHRPLIALCGKTWRYILVLKRCRKNVQGLTLCLLCSLHLQPAGELEGAQGPASLFLTPQCQGSLCPCPLWSRAGYRQRHTPSRLAGAELRSCWLQPLSLPLLRLPPLQLVQAEGKILGAKSLVLESVAQPNLAAYVSVRPRVSIPPRCSKR